jgi:hypothetical protein
MGKTFYIVGDDDLTTHQLAQALQAAGLTAQIEEAADSDSSPGYHFFDPQPICEYRRTFWEQFDGLWQNDPFDWEVLYDRS